MNSAISPHLRFFIKNRSSDLKIGMAELAKQTKMSTTSINHIMKGQRTVSDLFLERLAGVLLTQETHLQDLQSCGGCPA